MNCLFHHLVFLLAILAVIVDNAQGFVGNRLQQSDTNARISGRFHSRTSDSSTEGTSRRRDFLKVANGLVWFGLTSIPKPAEARFVLDDETGEFVEVEETDWQTAWKSRLDKASTMSKDEIFQAARGAGNLELREGPESDASKRRRAMSACRDATVRSKAGAGSEKECTARVFGGEVDFLLDAL